jgi:electron transfer flavoprotein alpha subunit
VITDAVSMEVEEDRVIVTRPAYGERVNVKLASSSTPQIIVLRGHAFTPFPPDPLRTGTLCPVDVNLTDEDYLTKVVGDIPYTSQVQLTDATVIIAGGRGVANAPNLIAPDGMSAKDWDVYRGDQGFRILSELAEVLHGAVGASRPAVEAGYITYDHQIGQTGKNVSPKLYIACGLSGAIQHVSGIRTSKVIVSINPDPNAPIFQVSHYGVVGDFSELVPALTEAFRKRLSR